MIKVILDTNVIVSSLVFGRKLESILEGAFLSKFELIYSSHLEKECCRILVQKFQASLDLITKIQKLFQIGNQFEIPKNRVFSQDQSLLLEKMKMRDSKDMFLLELLFASRVKVLVTGDKDLLILKEDLKRLKLPFQILSPSEFTAFLNSL